MALYWSFLLPSFVCLAFTCFNQCFLEYYLAGASLGKIVDMLFVKGILSPTGNLKWTRASVDKLLSNKKYVPLVGMEVYLDA